MLFLLLGIGFFFAGHHVPLRVGLGKLFLARRCPYKIIDRNDLRSVIQIVAFQYFFQYVLAPVLAPVLATVTVYTVFSTIWMK